MLIGTKYSELCVCVSFKASDYMAFLVAATATTQYVHAGSNKYVDVHIAKWPVKQELYLVPIFYALEIEVS